MRGWLAGTLLAAAMGLAGCGGREQADVDTSRPSEFGYQTTPKTVLLLEGKAAYERYCIGCHGPKGDGAGEAARFLNPRPRDFTQAQYKFISTRFGELPTDEDLFRTITNGLKGSAMPGWSQLPTETRWALIAYIKSFSDVWQRGKTPEIPFVTDPYADQPDKTEAIRRGEMAYHGFFTCWNCHPSYVGEEEINEYLTAMGGRAREAFRPDLHLAAIKADSAGETIFAPDFLRDYVKSGQTVRDLYRTIAAGITGTAMPTWVDSVGEESAPRDAEGKLLASSADLWALAYYVQDLIMRRPPRIAADQIHVRTDRALVFGPDRATYVARPQEQAAEDQAEEEEFFEE